MSDSKGESSPNDFDPAVHGFGFSNWAGDIGTGTDGDEFEYEPVEVTREEILRAIDDSWTTALSKAHRGLMSRIVYSWVGKNAATNGHCYGMAFSAEDYFRNPSKLPAGVDSASEIPRPTDEYDVVGDRIRRFQTSQILHAEPFWFAFLGLRWGLADHRESLRQLTDAIDAVGTGGIALTGEADAHQVLAHGYERRDGVTDVFVYDPSYEAVAHENQDGVWTLSVDRETGDVLEIADGYEEFLYHSPEMNLSVVDRTIGGRDRVLENLSNAVFLGLETGGELEIDVPDGVLVDRPDAEYANQDRAPYADAAVVLGAPDDLEISIDGEAGNEYSLETFGLRDGDTVLEEVVSATPDEVPARLRIRADETGDFVVDVVEDTKQETKETTEGGEEAVEGASEGIGRIEDNWWIAAAGGALGLGTAVWYLLGPSDDGDET